MAKAEEYENRGKENNPSEEEKFTLTEWGCLVATLTDYGVDTSNITARVGQHMVEDFLNLMVRCGYIGLAEGTQEKKV